MYKQLVLAAVLTLALVGISGVAMADPVTYTFNGATTWADTGTGWTPNGAYPQAADTALFNKHTTPLYQQNPATISVALSSDTAVGTLTFSDNTPYAFNSGTLTLGSGGLTDRNTNTITINSILAGTGAINIYPGTYIATWQNGGGWVSSAKLVLTNNANSFTGPINVYGGQLVVGGAYNGAITDPGISGASIINLGSQGSYGTLGINAHPVTVTKNFTLNGNGGVLRSVWGWDTYTGSFSGSGQLVLDGDRIYLQGAGNAYSGGTRVWGGWIDAGLTTGDAATGAGSTTANVLGTGDVYVEYSGCLSVGYASNLGATAQVHVIDDNFGKGIFIQTQSIAGVQTDFVPNFSADSNGIFAINCTSGANINARLAAGQAQLGSGYMSYGSRFGGTFTGATLLAGADNIYRFTGNGTWLTLSQSPLNNNTSADYGVTVSAMQASDFGLSIQGVNNTFSGTLTINARAYYQQRYGTTSDTNTPMGATGGNIVMNGSWCRATTPATLQLYGSAGASQKPFVKNDLSFTSQNRIYLNGNNSGAVGLDLTTLTRANRGTIFVDGIQGQLGATTGNSEQLVVASPGADLTSVNGMVSPAYTSSNNNGGSNFLDYGAAGKAGFSLATYKLAGAAGVNVTSTADLATAISSDIINVTAAANTPGAGITVNAVKTAANIGGTGALTIGSGGLIMAANANLTISAPLNFGATEGVIYSNSTNNGNNMVLSGQITGSNGLTFSGYWNNMITLDADNSTTLSGPITVNSGLLRVHDKNLNALGSGGLVLNGGEIYFDTYYINIPTAISIGTSGGWVTGNGMFLTGPISGSGALYWENPTNSGITSSGSGNTYSGGTYISGRCGISGPATLGTGPILIDRYSYLNVGSANSISPTQRITFVGTAQSGQTGELDIPQNNTAVGSIEGNGGTIRIGVVHNGNGTANYTFTVGGDNTSTEFMGSIMDYSTAAGDPDTTTHHAYGSIVKTGAGTWTLGGYSAYSGFTTINQGGIVLNGTLAATGQSSVYSMVTVGNDTGNTAFLGGTGVVARDVTVKATGTLTGSLHIGGSVTSTGTINMGAARIDGGLTSNGGSVALGAGTVAGEFDNWGNCPVTVAGTTFNSLVDMEGGTYSGTSTINNEFDFFGSALSGAHTINGDVFLANSNGSMAVNANLTVNGGDMYVGQPGSEQVAIVGNTTMNSPNRSLWLFGSMTGANNITASSVWVNPYGTAVPSTLSGTGTINATNFVVRGANSTVSGSMALNVTNGVAMYGGTLKGGHTITGGLTATAGSHATINPSNDATSVSTLTVVGNVTLDSTTALTFNLGPSGVGGTSNDLISITGALNLAGTLTVNPLGGFGTASSSYTLFTFTPGQLTDNGLAVNQPDPSNYTCSVLTNNSLGVVTLSVAASRTPGDVNGDHVANQIDLDLIYANFGGGSLYDINGDGAVNQLDITYELTNIIHCTYADSDLNHNVNFTDFTQILNYWQMSGQGWATGDFTGDTIVNFSDFSVLLNYWNPAGTEGASVPEPATLALLGLGALGLIRRKNRK